MNFFEVQVVYERQTGEPIPALIKESYLVESINPSSAENRLLEEIKPYISGECEVLRIIQRKFFDYILNNEDEYFWYKMRVDIITLDEKNGRDVRKAVTVYVQASSMEQAIKSLHSHLELLDCEITCITKTPILELYRAV